MAALTGNVQRPVKPPVGGIGTYPVRLAGYTNRGSGNTAYTCFKGAIIACDTSDTDGYFGPLDFTPASGDIFGGIGEERQDIGSTDTADGAKKLTVIRDGIVGFLKGSLAITDVGADIYATTDNDIQTSSTDALLIGRLVDVDATYAWVDISVYWMKPTA